TGRTEMAKAKGGKSKARPGKSTKKPAKSPAKLRRSVATRTRSAGPAIKPLWQPSPVRVAASNVTAFMAQVEQDWGVKHRSYKALWRWSVDEPGRFWTSVWNFCGVIAETRGTRALINGNKMPGAKFFPDAKLNFAENLLRRRDSGQAMVFWGEDKVKRSLTWG